MATSSEILHVAREAEWLNNQQTGYYQPDAFAEDGFVHCCLPDQLGGVLERYFQDDETLQLLTIDVSLLACPVKYEGLTLQSEKFPHVYGAIPLAAIVRSESLATS